MYHVVYLLHFLTGNSDLIACTVIMKDQPKMRRFMVIDSHQFILIEPDNTRLGWGITKFVSQLQDVEISGDKEDSRSLLATIRSSNNGTKKDITTARFIFDDHIRCMAAKQRLTKGRIKIRQKKMMEIAKLIDLDPINELNLSRKSVSLSNRDSPRSQSQNDTLTKRHLYQSHPNSAHRPICRGSVPGFAVAHSEKVSSSSKLVLRRGSNPSSFNSSNQGVSSRESSPLPGLKSELSQEMIPLENLSPKSERRRNRSQSENRNSNN
jgi:gro-1 operon gene protein 1